MFPTGSLFLAEPVSPVMISPVISSAFSPQLFSAAEASPSAFRPLATSRILDGVVRAYPALANGVLFARSTHELVAVELPPLTAGRP